MAQENNNLSLAELRKIIHVLKMENFANVEAEALSIIKIRISELPTPEALLSLSNTPKALDFFRHEISEIMRMIELYGTKDFEFKARYKALKNNLPPRYKVLNWVDTKKSEKINQLVKISEKLDNDGYILFSDNIINLAYNFDNINNEDINNISKKLIDIGYISEANEINENL